MNALLLALPLLSPLSQEALAPAAVAEPVPLAAPLRFATCWAVEHDGDAALRDALVREGEVWHDAGLFLVGAFSPETVDALALRGIASTALGASDMAGDLWVVSDAEVAHLGGKLSPVGKELLHAPGARLLLLPSGVEPQAAGTDEVHRCHVGMTCIQRRAWKPLLPKYWQGATGAGTERTATAHDPRIQALVDQVNQANLSNTVATLSAIFNRRASKTGCFQARDLIRGWFQSFGLTTRLEGFGGGYAENVLAEIPGTRYPNEWVLIGAHYDSLSQAGSNSRAPGADDNASGTAGVVEAARILAAAGPFERSLRFVTFGAEELGLIGSNASAQNSSNAGEDIVAMVNTDMNSYRRAGDTMDCDFILNSTNGALNRFAKETGALYVSNWAYRDMYLMGGSSDHASYTAHGFPAIFPFEDARYSPYIHTANDDMTNSAIDFDLAEMIVKSVLATAVARGELMDMQITHTPLPDTTTSHGPFLVQAQVVSLTGNNVTGVSLFYSGDGGQTYGSLAMDPQGGGNYEAWIPSFGSPVGIWYYMVASDDQGASEAAPEGIDAGGPAYAFFVGQRLPIYETGFEADDQEGWYWTGHPIQEGWMRGPPFGKAGDATHAYEGGRVWGNDRGILSMDGAYEPNHDATLSTPVIDCSGATNVYLEFQRWLTVEDAAHDQASVLVNGNVVWQNAVGQDHIDTSWVPVSIDISSLAAGNANVVVQFRLQADGVVQFGGWNIDAFALVEKYPATGDLHLYGSGVNPPGSLTILSGTPSIGDTVVVGVDNPLGTQVGPGLGVYVLLSTAPDPNYPAGSLAPGYGMSSLGADGELLIDLASWTPGLTLVGPAWTGTGAPSLVPLAIPNDTNLIGVDVYGQGLLIAPAATSGLMKGLTDAVHIHIQP